MSKFGEMNDRRLSAPDLTRQINRLNRPYAYPGKFADLRQADSVEMLQHPQNVFILKIGAFLSFRHKFLDGFLLKESKKIIDV